MKFTENNWVAVKVTEPDAVFEFICESFADASIAAFEALQGGALSVEFKDNGVSGL